MAEKHPTKSLPNVEWFDRATWGNRIVRGDGYILVRCPRYPQSHKNGYVLEHRLVMASHLRRPLLNTEHVHHKNEIRHDNRIENLELTTNSEHRRHHNSQTPKEVFIKRASHLVAHTKANKIPRELVACACGCGQGFTTPDSKGRYHKFIQGHNQRGRNWKWNNG